MQAQDIITALTNQRNAAQNESAQLFAMMEDLKRQIAERDKTITKLRQKKEQQKE